MSVEAPISALSVPSVHPSDNEHQEIPDEIAGTNHGEIFLAKIVSKISDDITLTQCNVKLPEKTPCNSNGVKVHGRIPVRIKMGEIHRETMC